MHIQWLASSQIQTEVHSAGEHERVATKECSLVVAVKASHYAYTRNVFLTFKFYDRCACSCALPPSLMEECCRRRLSWGLLS